MLLLDLAADTFCQMVVDKACCLQMRVAKMCIRDSISAFRQEVSGNAVSPPQLAADTPVLDVLQPVLISVLIFGRVEFQVDVYKRQIKEQTPHSPWQVLKIISATLHYLLQNQ